jgi:PAS domain S-box-containing protein
MGEGIVHLTGYPAAEMTTELFTSLIEAVTLRGAAAQFTLEEALQRARTGELAEWQSDIRIRDHAGRTRWLADGAIEITGPDGRSLGAIGVLQDITDRKEAEAALHQWNETLEQRVAERTEALRLRTAQLEAVNRELESFTYTVSHDLRAPIRAVDGFAHLLLEEFHERLGASGRHYLERVRDNTRQMGTLIDDLLAFTRLGRLTPRRMAIAVQDIERMIQATAEQLQADPPVDIVVGALPPCHADLALLRQVFGHLLANAFKFTRRRPGARIEVGGQLAEAGPLYFVRDNGVGFDMQYVHKLFGVFQRLHRVEEYEGTGVGLAIVQRIVQKHGGRVWAEAEPDKGATFFFTLPALTNETVPSDQTR